VTPFHQVPRNSKTYTDHNIEEAISYRKRADQEDPKDHGSDVSVGNQTETRPQANEWQTQNKQNDVSEIHAGDHSPGEVAPYSQFP